MKNNIVLLEHTDFCAGDVYEESLIFGGIGGILNEMVISESTSANGPMKFRGKFQEADAVNKNKRTYPFEVLDRNVGPLLKACAEGKLTGELDHPTDSIIHFKDASHKITKLWWEGNVLMGEGVILSTPAGKILRALINDGVSIGISSRGVGNGKVNEDGILVIGESYKLITFDAVADPSTYEAYQRKVVGSGVKKENNLYNFQQKNEETSLYTRPNKELLLACLGGMFNKYSKEVLK